MRSAADILTAYHALPAAARQKVAPGLVEELLTIVETLQRQLRRYTRCGVARRARVDRRCRAAHDLITRLKLPTAGKSAWRMILAALAEQDSEIVLSRQPPVSIDGMPDGWVIAHTIRPKTLRRNYLAWRKRSSMQTGPKKLTYSGT